MSARQTHLDVATATLGGSSILGELRDVSIEIINEDEDSRTVAVRHGAVEIVKRDITITAAMFVAVSSAKKAGIDVATISFGVTPHIGDVTAFNLRITTDNFEGSGVADDWRFPCASGTQFEGELTMLIADGAASSLFATAGGAISGLGATLAIVAATSGFDLSCAIKIVSVVKRIERQNGIELTVRIKQNGTPTVSGESHLVDILTGDSVMAYAFDDGVDAVSGNALITEASLEFGQAALQLKNVTLKNQGTPTIT